MNKGLILGIICLMGMMGLSTIVSAEVYEGDYDSSHITSDISYTGLLVTNILSEAVGSSREQYSFRSGPANGITMTKENYYDVDGTIYNDFYMMNIGYDEISMTFGKSPENYMLNPFASFYDYRNILRINKDEFQYAGFDVCTSSGNCKSTTSGWSGTCPENYKLIVKNGLITDCKRR